MKNQEIEEKARELADMVGSVAVDETTIRSYRNDRRYFKRGLRADKTGSS